MTREEVIKEFENCLSSISHCRAGWDYELTREQRAQEDRQEKISLALARRLWTDNAHMHADLEAAFTAFQPLATMAEIQRTP